MVALNITIISFAHDILVRTLDCVQLRVSSVDLIKVHLPTLVPMVG